MGAEATITENGIGVHPRGLLVLPPEVADKIAAFVPTKQIGNEGVSITTHVPDTVQLLRNNGYEVPSPVSVYNWGNSGRQPYPHQVETVEMLITEPQSAVLSGLGSGKSACVAWSYDLMHRLKMVDWLVVFAPLSTLHSTWASEFFVIFPEKEVVVAHNSVKAKRLKLLNTNAEVTIMNSDAISIGEVHRYLVDREGDGMFAIDEMTYFKTYGTSRSKAMRDMLKQRKAKKFHDRVTGLTGLPCPNDATDAYGQLHLLYPERQKMRFRSFREATQVQLSQFRWRDRPEAKDMVLDWFQPAVCFKTRDCVDLPETIDHYRRVQLSAEQTKAFNAMANQLTVTLNNEELTAVNEASKRIKLLQIVLGFMYSEDGDAAPHELNIGTRITEISDAIDSTEGKTLVFAPFKAAVHRIHRELKGSFECEVVTGDVTANKRTEIFRRFQDPNDPLRVIVAQPASMSHGVTLTEADTIIWAAPCDGFETYHQANARIVRPGQKRVTNIMHIYGSDLERQIFSRLKDRQSLTGLLTDMFAAETKKRSKP